MATHNPVVTTLLLMLKHLQESAKANKQKVGTIPTDRFIKDFTFGSIKLNRQAGHTPAVVQLANRFSKTQNVVVMTTSEAAQNFIKAAGLEMNPKLTLCNAARKASYRTVITPSLVLFDSYSFMSPSIIEEVVPWFNGALPEALVNCVFLGVG